MGGEHGGQRGQSPLHFIYCLQQAVNSNTYFIKSCLFHTDVIQFNINTDFGQAIPNKLLTAPIN